MAEKAGDAFVELSVDDRKFKRGLSTSQGRFQKFGAGLGTIAAGVGVAAGAALAAGIGKGLKLFQVQEEAVASLKASFSDLGEGAQAATDDFVQFAGELQKQTKFGDEVIIQQAAIAKNLGVTGDKLKEATRAAIGLTAKGIDLKTAFNLIARASTGNTGLLSRYGIVLKSTGSAQEKFNELLAMGAADFDKAAALSDTVGGRFQQLKNAIGDLFEEVGGAFAGGSGLKDFLKGFTDVVQALTPKIVRVVQVATTFANVLIGNVVEGIKVAFRNISSLTDAFGGFAGSGDFVKDALIGILQTLNTVINRAQLFGAVLNDILTGNFKNIKGDIESFNRRLAEGNRRIRESFQSANRDGVAATGGGALSGVSEDEEAGKPAKAGSQISLAQGIQEAQKKALDSNKPLEGINHNTARLVKLIEEEIQLERESQRLMERLSVFGP